MTSAMPLDTAIIVPAGGRASDALRTLVDADGSAAHPFVRRLVLADRRSGRPAADAPAAERRAARPGGVPLAARTDLADALHALCAVHGSQRGLVELAGERAGAGPAGAWLAAAAPGFAAERALVARLVAASGPLPSTPGQAATDAAWAAQRHAFAMLARSDRAGVAAGAAAAFALDWAAVRRVLERGAEAWGVEPRALALPHPAEFAAVVDLVAAGPAERAFLFGARAVLEQHRAFWTVLEARAAARRG